MSGKANLAAAVAARLLNRARQAGDDYQTLLTSYCLERFLYRLAVSDLRDRFVLKGAMLLRVWSARPYRATLDLDLLRRGDAAFDAVREDLRAIATTQVPPDAVDFDDERVRIEAIRAEDEYAGVRATLPARHHTVQRHPVPPGVEGRPRAGRRSGGVDADDQRREGRLAAERTRDPVWIPRRDVERLLNGEDN